VGSQGLPASLAQLELAARSGGVAHVLEHSFQPEHAAGVVADREDADVGFHDVPGGVPEKQLVPALEHAAVAQTPQVPGSHR
jgi:hypothetical protein